jgi:hypothetical protein
MPGYLELRAIKLGGHHVEASPWSSSSQAGGTGLQALKLKVKPLLHRLSKHTNYNIDILNIMLKQSHEVSKENKCN